MKTKIIIISLFLLFVHSAYCSGIREDMILFIGLKTDLQYTLSLLNSDGNLREYNISKIDFNEDFCSIFSTGINLAIGTTLSHELNIDFNYGLMFGDFERKIHKEFIENNIYQYTIQSDILYQFYKIKAYFGFKIFEIYSKWLPLYSIKLLIGGSLTYYNKISDEYQFHSDNGIQKLIELNKDFVLVNNNKATLNNKSFNDKVWKETSICIGLFTNYLCTELSRNSRIFIRPSILYEFHFKSSLFNSYYNSIGIGLDLRFGFKINTDIPDNDDSGISY